jgi:hypothetical protein
MDFPANNKEKPDYKLEFSDEFENPILDRSKWFPFMLPHWSTLECAKWIIFGAISLLADIQQKLDSSHTCITIKLPSPDVGRRVGDEGRTSNNLF